jgi:uncharacterized membrane protein (UPF0136 family)
VQLKRDGDGLQPSDVCLDICGATLFVAACAVFMGARAGFDACFTLKAEVQLFNGIAPKHISVRKDMPMLLVSTWPRLGLGETA